MKNQGIRKQLFENISEQQASQITGGSTHMRLIRRREFSEVVGSGFKRVIGQTWGAIQDVFGGSSYTPGSVNGTVGVRG